MPQFSEEEHGALSGVDEVAPSALASEGFDGGVEDGGDSAEDGFDGDAFAVGFGEWCLHEELSEDLVCHGEVDFAAHDAAVGDEACEGSFECAHVALYRGGDVEEYRLWDVPSFLPAALLYDGEPCFEVGRGDVCDEAAFETASEPFVDGAQVFRALVAGDDDLFPALVEGVEGVEELLFCALFACDELYVVHKPDIDVSADSSEGFGFALSQCGDEVVCEAFSVDHEDVEVGMECADEVSDGVEEVCFAKPAASVEKEGVVDFAGVLCDGLCRGVCEAVAGPDDVVFEVVAVQERHAGHDLYVCRAYAGCGFWWFGWGGGGGDLGEDGFCGPVFEAHDAEDEAEGRFEVAGEFGLDEFPVAFVEPLSGEGVVDCECDGGAVVCSGAYGFDVAFVGDFVDPRGEREEGAVPCFFQLCRAFVIAQLQLFAQRVSPEVRAIIARAILGRNVEFCGLDSP